MVTASHPYIEVPLYLFSFLDRCLASIYYCTEYSSYTEAYLTWAANCSQGANLELLLRGHHFTYTLWRYQLSYQISTVHWVHTPQQPWHAIQLSKPPVQSSSTTQPLTFLADNTIHSKTSCNITLCITWHRHYADVMPMLHECYTRLCKLTPWVTWTHNRLCHVPGAWLG